MWNHLKSYLTALLAAMILAFFVFSAAMPRFVVLTAAALLAELCVLLLYGRMENAAFLIKYLCIELGCILIYLLHWEILDRVYRLSNLDAGEWSIAVAAAVGAVTIAVMAGIGLCTGRKQRKTDLCKERPLFQEREHDLARLEGFLRKDAPLIGVDAPWGEGKTFLLDHLCAKLAKDYEIVRIGVLAGHVDELETTLINEFDRILRRNRIFSHSSRQMMKLLESSSLLKQLRALFVEDTGSVSETLDGVLRDMAGLKKRVLIVVDDIERLSDDRQIRKLFAMMERVSSPKLQVVYLFNHRRLNDDFDRDYLEKYIPCYMELTPIRFRSAVREFWTELNMDATQVECEKVEKLADYPDYSNSIMRIVAADSFPEVRGFRLDNYQVRRVRSFLNEFRDLTLQENEPVFVRSAEDRWLLLKCLFIKHFLPKTFERFSIAEEAVDSFRFHLDVGRMPALEAFNITDIVDVSLSDLFDLRRCSNGYEQMRSLMETVLSDQENYNELIAASMLKFDYFDILLQIEAKESGQKKLTPAQSVLPIEPHIEILERYGNTDISQIKREQNNERINRVIWNLLANGASERTNLDAFVSHFQKTVLDAAPAQRAEAWGTFCFDAFHSKTYKNNITCERLGVDRFLPLFQGFRVTGASVEYWLGLLDFYFSRQEQTVISVEMVQNLNNVDLTHNAVYLSVLRHFMQCEIAGNLNAEPCMSRFLKRILRIASSLGYVRGFAFERLVDVSPVEDAIKEEESILPSKQWMDETMELYSQFPFLKAELEKSKLRISMLACFDDDLQTIQDFLDFCGKLIEAKKPLKMNGGFHVSVDSKSISHHQDVVDGLEAQFRQGATAEEMYGPILEAYQKGLLDPGEVRTLLGKMMK